MNITLSREKLEALVQGAFKAGIDHVVRAASFVTHDDCHNAIAAYAADVVNKLIAEQRA